MKPLLLFDIDHTLFDTDSFSRIYRTQFLKYLGITSKKFEDVRLNYHHSLAKHTDYQPEEFIKHTINSLHLDKKPKIYSKLNNLFFARENFSRSLFADTLSALTKLKTRYRLGIFSEGQPSYQKTKLVKSGLFDLLDPQLIFIHRRKTQPYILHLLPSDCTIVDDDIEVITSLVKSDRSIPIWLNRKDKSVHPSATTVHTLSELMTL